MRLEGVDTKVVRSGLVGSIFIDWGERTRGLLNGWFAGLPSSSDVGAKSFSIFRPGLVELDR